MVRETPNAYLESEPCLVTAVYCATGFLDSPHGYPDVRPDGYVTLTAANKWIRDNLRITKRIDYKKGERPKLKDLHLKGQAVVCVLGHYVFLDHETYWSFFDNKDDDVVALWMLKEEISHEF